MGNNIQYFSIEMRYLISQKKKKISFRLLFFITRSKLWLIISLHIVIVDGVGVVLAHLIKTSFFFSTWIYFEELFKKIMYHKESLRLRLVFIFFFLFTCPLLCVCRLFRTQIQSSWGTAGTLFLYLPQLCGRIMVTTAVIRSFYLSVAAINISMQSKKSLIKYVSNQK